ncbi:MAG: hypothetical protein ACTHKM_13430 [Tsuneonella sp.]
MRYFALALPLAAVALAGCSQEPSQAEIDKRAVTDLNHARSTDEAVAMAKALPAGDFTVLRLGGRTRETVGAMTNPAGAFADLRSYVACPAGMDPCNPASAPAGTIFTYVLVAYPGGDNDDATGIGAHTHASDIERATEFRLTAPAHGFTGHAGYAKPEALAAIGPKADVVITCHDGSLAWTVSAGDGGNQWEQKEPLTFYWQSTLPPGGESAVYALDTDGTTSAGKGPYPGATEGAQNACG